MKGPCIGPCYIDNDLSIQSFANGTFLILMQVSESQVANPTNGIVIARCFRRGFFEWLVTHQTLVMMLGAMIVGVVIMMIIVVVVVSRVLLVGRGGGGGENAHASLLSAFIVFFLFSGVNGRGGRG